MAIGLIWHISFSFADGHFSLCSSHGGSPMHTHLLLWALFHLTRTETYCMTNPPNHLTLIISKVPTVKYCILLETLRELWENWLGDSPLSVPVYQGISGLGLHLDIPVRDCGDHGNWSRKTHQLWAVPSVGRAPRLTIKVKVHCALTCLSTRLQTQCDQLPLATAATSSLSWQTVPWDCVWA